MKHSELFIFSPVVLALRIPKSTASFIGFVSLQLALIETVPLCSLGVPEGRGSWEVHKHPCSGGAECRRVFFVKQESEELR